MAVYRKSERKFDGKCYVGSCSTKDGVDGEQKAREGRWDTVFFCVCIFLFLQQVMF